MKTSEKIKRDMAECAKRAEEVIMYSCDVGEMAEYTETVKNTLIVGRSLLRRLEQDNAQKDERIRQLEQRAPRWISVEERLPEGEDPVLILVKETEHYGLNKDKSKVYHCQYLAYWDDEEWYTTWCNGCRKISDTANEPNADDYEVTHWMPLPEPPEEGV